MAPLVSGRYTITNARFDNVAVLPDDDQRSDIVSGVYNNIPDALVRLHLSDTDGQPIHFFVQWDILLLSNDMYTIKNCRHNSYVNREPNSKKGESIFAGDRPEQWRIKEMRKKGHYVHVFRLFPLSSSPSSLM